MTPGTAFLAAFSLGALAGCTEIDAPIATPLDLLPPPEALLGSPSRAPSPVDPRFVDALTAYARATRALRSAGGDDALPQLRQALRLLADVVALLPGPPRQREPAFQAANELRVTVARMATTYENDPRAQIAQAAGSLRAIAAFLRESASGGVSSPEVLAWTRTFERAAGVVDPADRARRLSQVRAALDAAERALEATLRALPSTPR